MPRLLCFALGILACATLARADVLRLKSGGTVEGTVVEETTEEYVVDTRVGRLRVKRAQVASLERKEPDETPRLAAELRVVLARLGEGRAVAARRAWEALPAIPSPAWKSHDAQATLLAEQGWDPPVGQPRTFATFSAYLERLTRDLCFSCEALGRRPCAECAGRGRAPCPECKGRPPECVECAGKGAVKCETCDGKARTRCPECEDSRIPGFHVTEEVQRVMVRYDFRGGPVYEDRVVLKKTMCATCKGNGKVACVDCGSAETKGSAGPAARPAPGKRRCPECAGSGRDACRAGCDDGLSPVPCRACAGEGRLPCADCGGSGRKKTPETEGPR